MGGGGGGCVRCPCPLRHFCLKVTNAAGTAQVMGSNLAGPVFVFKWEIIRGSFIFLKS